MPDARLYVPDELLLRRFGLVRAVGGAAYFLAVAVLAGIFGWQVWPLALGVPVLAVVTTAFFSKSQQYPRLSVVASLVADALVLGGAVAFLGGTGSGMVMLYAIVIVSAGILLGPASAWAFTTFAIALSMLQFGLEQAGVPPVLLHRPDVGERLPVLLVSLGCLASVGYLCASYAGRLQELIAEAGERAEAVQRRGRRRRRFVQHATVQVRRPLAELEAVADALDERWAELGESERRRLAARLRMGVMRLDTEVAQLADVSTLDETGEDRPQAVALRRVVEDCLVDLGDRLEAHVVDFDMPPLKIVGDRRAARRVVFNILENAVEHTPPGTIVQVTAVTTPGHVVLVVTDNGPGIPPAVVRTMFEPPPDQEPRVGLPLVRELCEAMGAELRYEPVAGRGGHRGGARFLISFRMAPRGTPTPEDEAEGEGEPRRAGAGR